MSLHFERAITFDHGEGQFERRLRVDAWWQAVEFKAEMAAAGRRALRGLRDGQRPFAARAFDEQCNWRVGRRGEIDKDQRLEPVVDAARRQADFSGRRRGW